MPLIDTELQKRLESPKYKTTIAAATKHQDRIALHTEIILERFGGNNAITEYLHWVEQLISEDAFRAYLPLLRFPLETVPLMSEIRDKLARIFDGRDSVFRSKFNSEGLRVKYEDWRSANNVQEKWKKASLMAMHIKINSVMILDNDPSQGINPYFYFLDIGRVIDFEPLPHSKTDLQWIAFKEDKETMIVIDDSSYRRYDIKDGYSKLKLKTEAPHDMGFCPARFFWDIQVNSKDPFVKKSPYSEYLYDMDWTLLFGGNKKNLDLYGSQPILSGFRADCDFEMDGKDDDDHWECNSGYLVDSRDRYVMNGRELHRCPKCNPKNKISPGTFIRVASPTKDNDFADLRNPVSMTTVDRPSLDYNKEEKSSLQIALIKSITGYTGDPINNQAINTDQVKSFRDAETNKLISLKGSFEKAQSWVETGLAKMLLGSGSVESIEVNYGNEFYLATAEEIASQYGKARERHQPTTILNELEDQYYATRYRLNPDLWLRNRMISDIEPFKHVTKADLLQLLNLNMITREEFYLKVNFASLLDEFERDNINVEQFAVDETYKSRVKRIREALILLVQPRLAQPAPPDPNDEPGIAQNA